MDTPAPARRRDRRAALLRARTRSRLRAVAVATAILAGATVLGLGAAGTSYALLNARDTMPGATVSAGTAELTVDGLRSAALGDFTPTPVAPSARAIVVKNTGHAPLALRTSVTATTRPALLANTLLRVTPVDSRAACVAGLGGAQAPLDGHVAEGLGTVPPAGERILCLEVALRQGTPAAQSGQQLNFELGVSGVQASG